MPLGFASPSILFLGNLGAPMRRWAQDALTRLWATGRYDRYIEPGVGAFALSLVAKQAGIPVAAMDTSDIGLYSSACGALFAGQDLHELGVRVDGELLELPDDPLQATALILFTQLRLRMAAKPPHTYWLELQADLDRRKAEHLHDIAEDLERQRAELRGLAYRPADIFEHLGEIADDPRAIIVADPPSYRLGFEKFYNTDGRLTWAEPAYGVWDPATDFDRLMAMFAGKPALLLLYQECAARKAASPDPLHAAYMAQGWVFYWLTNQLDTMLPLVGRTVDRGDRAPYEPLDLPILEPHWPISPSSTIEVIPVRPTVAGYYKHLWIHRIKSVRAPLNAVVLIDGVVAGVIGWDWTTITQARPHTRSLGTVQYVYGAGAPHDLRLHRLITALACQRRVLEGIGMADLFTTGAVGISTAVMTPYPESKQLRGLMKLIVRMDDPLYGYRLTYHAPVGTSSPEEVLATWLATEQQYQRSRMPRESTSDKASSSDRSTLVTFKSRTSTPR